MGKKLRVFEIYNGMTPAQNEAYLIKKKRAREAHKTLKRTKDHANVLELLELYKKDEYGDNLLDEEINKW